MATKRTTILSGMGNVRIMEMPTFGPAEPDVIIDEPSGAELHLSDIERATWVTPTLYDRLVEFYGSKE